jgi:transposase-like protein
MVNIQDLFDDAKCYQTIREMRWPDGVTCPQCSSDSVIKNGRDDTEPHRQRYECRGCRQRFDDLTDTIFAGHHQPLRTWIACLYLMGLNLSGLQIAQELDINKDDARAMIQRLRQGIVERRPPVVLEGEVECDEVYVVAGHKGHPEAVKKREAPPPKAPERGAWPRDAGQGEATDLRNVAAWRRGRDSDAGERQAGNDRAADRADDRQGDFGLHR